MATLVNYKYDKKHDYIVKTEIPQSDNQVDKAHKVVIYDRPLLNALREAILGENSGIKPNLKHDNAKK